MGGGVPPRRHMWVTCDLYALSKSPEPADKHNYDSPGPVKRTQQMMTNDGGRAPYWGVYVQLSLLLGPLMNQRLLRLLIVKVGVVNDCQN